MKMINGGWEFTGQDAQALAASIQQQQTGRWEKDLSKKINYTTKDAAAIAWTIVWGQFSIDNKFEISSFIYRTFKKGDGEDARKRREYNFTTPVYFKDKDKRQHQSPFDRKETQAALGFNNKIVGHIHSHGSFDRPTDLDFSDHEHFSANQWVDEDNIIKHNDIDHYLANPAGQLKVWRYFNNRGATILGSGFYHDDKVTEWGKNKNPLKWNLEPDIYNEKNHNDPGND